MHVRGIRGATVVEADERVLILEATKEPLEAPVQDNDVAVDDIASILFTMTPDLQSVYPAQQRGDSGGNTRRCWGRRRSTSPGVSLDASAS